MRGLSSFGIIALSTLAVLSTATVARGQEHPAVDLPAPHAAPAAPMPGWLGLVTDDNKPGSKGLQVIQVAAEGPAAAAGIRVGDRIVKVDDQAIGGVADMMQALSGKQPGTQIVLTVDREGTEELITVRLARRPASPPGAPSGGQAHAPHGQLPDGEPGPSPTGDVPFALPFARRAMLGARVLPLDFATRPSAAITVEHGALITEILPGTPADRAGLREGEVIVALDDRPVRDPQELAALLAAHRPGDEITLTVYNGNVPHAVSLTLAEVDGPAQPGFAPAPAPGDAAAEGAALADRLQTILDRLEALEQRLEALETRLNANR